MISGRNNLLFALTGGMLWFSIFAYTPQLSSFTSDLEATPVIIGVVMGIYGLSQLLLRIPFGILSDKLNNRTLFIKVGLFSSTTCAFLIFLKPSIPTLLIGRLLAGVGAASWVLATVLYSSHYPNDKASKAIGIANGINALGQMIAMILGGVVLLFFPTRYVFLLGGIGGLIGFISSFFLDENKSLKRDPLTFSEIVGTIKNKHLIKISILAIFDQFITFGVVFTFAPLLLKELGSSGSTLSLFSILGLIPMVFIPPLAGGYIVSKFGFKNTIMTGFFIEGLCSIIMPLSGSFLLLFILQFLMGVGRSMTLSILMGLSISGVETKRRATTMGVFQATYGLGILLGPIILGVVGKRNGINSGFILIGGLALLSMGLTHLFLREKEKKKGIISKIY